MMTKRVGKIGRMRPVVMLASCLLGCSGCDSAGSSELTDASGDATGQHFCAGSAHDFCGDFDESPDVTAGWTMAKQSGGCSFAPSSDYVSAPRSLQLTCMATGNGGQAGLSITTRLNPKLDLSVLHLTFDYKLEPYVFENDFQSINLFDIEDNGVKRISMSNNPTKLDGYHTGWIVTIGDGPLTYDGASLPLPPSQVPPLGIWEHAIMDVGWASDLGWLRLNWTGNPDVMYYGGLHTATRTLTDTVGLTVNLSSVGTTSPRVVMLIDNVTLDLF